MLEISNHQKIPSDFAWKSGIKIAKKPSDFGQLELRLGLGKNDLGLGFGIGFENLGSGIRIWDSLTKIRDLGSKIADPGLEAHWRATVYRFFLSRGNQKRYFQTANVVTILCVISYLSNWSLAASPWNVTFAPKFWLDNGSYARRVIKIWTFWSRKGAHRAPRVKFIAWHNNYAPRA